MRVVLLGPPGSGKGTQGVALARDRGIAHISSGDLLRRALDAAPDSEVGQAARVISRGEMVSDEIANRLAFDALGSKAVRQGFVLDGYPRTVAQAEALDGWLANRGLALDAVVLLEISEEELLRRLSARARADDSPEGIGLRRERYAARTAPLVDWYARRGLLRRVNAQGDPREVRARICTHLPSLV